MNDPVLLRVDEDRFWLALADSDAGLYARGVAVFAGLDVEVSEPHAYPMQIQGPRSKEVMETLFGQESEVMALRYYWCTRAELDGIPVVVSRTGWTGEVGFEIYLLDPTAATTCGSGSWTPAARTTSGRSPCEARRIEAGIFNYNSDMTIENNPFELMGMERLVELDQEADFIGKDALGGWPRRRARKLVGVEMPGDALSFEIAEAWPALHEGKHVGQVTDLIWSPRLERNIGYVWVPIELSSPGTTIQVETPSRVVDATTAAIPFLDPTKSPGRVGAGLTGGLGRSTVTARSANARAKARSSCCPGATSSTSTLRVPMPAAAASTDIPLSAPVWAGGPRTSSTSTPWTTVSV